MHRAFWEMPYRTAARNEVVISADEPLPPALLIHRGIAYSSHAFPNGNRAIIDIVLPTDIVGVERAVLGRPTHDVIAASALKYRLMPANTLRGLMATPSIAARVLAAIAEAKWRTEQHVVALARLDARGRIAAFLLGIYDRLRRADLIDRPTFNLYLTQDQIADHLGMTVVHVSRTLKRMHEQRLAIVDHGVVTIYDVERMRAIAAAEFPRIAAEMAGQPVSALP